MFFIKVKKNDFLFFFICKLMFLRCMIYCKLSAELPLLKLFCCYRYVGYLLILLLFNLITVYNIL